MAAGSHNSREREFSSFWYVQVGGNKKVRSAFKNYLFYLVLIPFDDAGNARLKRCFLGPGPEALLYLLTNVIYVCLGISSCIQGLPPLICLLFNPACGFNEIFLNHPGKSVERLD